MGQVGILSLVPVRSKRWDEAKRVPQAQVSAVYYILLVLQVFTIAIAARRVSNITNATISLRAAYSLVLSSSSSRRQIADSGPRSDAGDGCHAAFEI